MVAGNKKSGRFTQVKKRTPGGKLVTKYRETTPKQASCAVTGENLQGIPRKRPAGFRKLSKSQRRPNRPYGGVLSSKAMRIAIKESITEKKE